MSVYYIDSAASSGGDGLSEKSPLSSWKNLDLCPGDRVLLKCGSVFHESILSPSGAPGQPVTWSSYGKGAKPIITSSLDLLSGEWEEKEKNIYRYCGYIPSEVCNLWYGGSRFGILKFTYEELEKQGDFYYSGIGLAVHNVSGDPASYEFFLYSEKDPREVYPTLLASLYGDRSLAKAEHDVCFSKLFFMIGGVHGFAGTDCTNISISDCDFFGIGGAVWNKARRIRFGNGVEFWHDAHDVSLTDCRFDQIYDSCFTHQGCKPDATPDNVTVTGNIFRNYGMAAYEIRDRITTRTLFAHNTCENAGEGFSAAEGDRPRRSEIYPQPMGHHLFIWRINEPTEGGEIRIEHNIFGSADHGHTAYSIISPEAEKQFIFRGNNYSGCNRVFWNGKETACDILP